MSAVAKTRNRRSAVVGIKRLIVSPSATQSRGQLPASQNGKKRARVPCPSSKSRHFLHYNKSYNKPFWKDAGASPNTGRLLHFPFWDTQKRPARWRAPSSENNCLQVLVHPLLNPVERYL